MLLPILLFSQVGIGTTNPDSSAVLEVSSTTAGFLLPRMTLVQRDLIINPASGLMVFNLDSNALNFNSGTPSLPVWVAVFNTTSQSGSFDVGTTASGWNYYDITFSSPFVSIPSIQLTFREGVGVDNTGTFSVSQIKVANASINGFTIAIYETSLTNDIFIDWVANPKTQ